MHRPPFYTDLARSGVVRAAALTQVTGLTASANGYDDRVDGWGCAPSGCLPSNAIDGSLEYASRWSCVRYLIDGYTWDDNSQMCELTLDLPTPTDIKEVRAALWKGHKRSRSFNIVADGDVTANLTSSGTTESYETYDVAATLASKVVLQAQHTGDDNGWFSLLEVDRSGMRLLLLTLTTDLPGHGIWDKSIWCSSYNYLRNISCNI